MLDKPTRIIKNRKRLEEALNVEISQRGKEIFIDGDGKDKHIAKKVIQALDFGFSFSDALLLKGEEIFEVMNLKDYSKAKDMGKIRGLVIGKGGKALETLERLTRCSFEINNNRVGIIGLPEWLKIAIEGVRQLAQGTKHSNVYHYLEQHQPKPILDLGLKEEFKEEVSKEKNKR